MLLTRVVQVVLLSGVLWGLWMTVRMLRDS